MKLLTKFLSVLLLTNWGATWSLLDPPTKKKFNPPLIVFSHSLLIRVDNFSRTGSGVIPKMIYPQTLRWWVVHVLLSSNTRCCQFPLMNLFLAGISTSYYTRLSCMHQSIQGLVKFEYTIRNIVILKSRWFLADTSNFRSPFIKDFWHPSGITCKHEYSKGYEDLIASIIETREMSRHNRCLLPY